MPLKSRVKRRDFPILSAWGLLYLFRCLICIPCYTSLNLRILTLLFSLSLLLTILEDLRHSRICSSVLFNRDLGQSSSSKSVASFLLSSMICSVSFSSSSVSSCSSSDISTSSGSNLALNWSAWANIGCPFFSSTAVFCPFCRMNFALFGSAFLFLFYQIFSFVTNDMVIWALICLLINADGLCFLSVWGTVW